MPVEVAVAVVMAPTVVEVAPVAEVLDQTLQAVSQVQLTPVVEVAGAHHILLEESAVQVVVV